MGVIIIFNLLHKRSSPCQRLQYIVNIYLCSPVIKFWLMF
jgi:hypothetical protein